jgi:hypothetical protein
MLNCHDAFIARSPKNLVHKKNFFFMFSSSSTQNNFFISIAVYANDFSFICMQEARSHITHHKNDEGKYEEENKDVKVHSIYEEILIEELEATAKGGDERVKDFLVCHFNKTSLYFSSSFQRLIANLLNNSRLFHFFFSLLVN